MELSYSPSMLDGFFKQSFDDNQGQKLICPLLKTLSLIILLPPYEELHEVASTASTGKALQRHFE
jgi:hypothetical protein